MNVNQKIDINNPEPYVRLREVADRLSLHYDAVLAWTQIDGFPVLRTAGGRLRVRLSEVAKWLEQFQKEAK